MDKRQFIERAPLYYILAIGEFFRKSKEQFVSYEDIQKEYFVIDGEFAGGYGEEFLKIGVLFDFSIDWLCNRGFVSIYKDNFGPTLFQRNDAFDFGWEGIAKEIPTPFGIFYKLGEDNRKKWLISALKKVNENYVALQITKEDISQTSSFDDEWAPIAIERGNIEVSRIEATLDSAIEELRGDNGYGSAHQEEKEYVTENLIAVRKKFQLDASISWAYIRKRALDPLGILIKRFGKASLGILAEAAKAAIKDWLQKRGITFLDDHF